MIVIFVVVIAFSVPYQMSRSFAGTMVLKDSEYWLKGYLRIDDIAFFKNGSLWIENQEYKVLDLIYTNEIVAGEDGKVYQAILIGGNWSMELKENYKSIVAVYRTEKKTWVQRYMKW